MLTGSIHILLWLDARSFTPTNVLEGQGGTVTAQPMVFENGRRILSHPQGVVLVDAESALQVLPGFEQGRVVSGSVVREVTDAARARINTPGIGTDAQEVFAFPQSDAATVDDLATLGGASIPQISTELDRRHLHPENVVNIGLSTPVVDTNGALGTYTGSLPKRWLM